MLTLKTDIVWAAVVGPVTSMEIAASAGLEPSEVSALLNNLYKQGRIERAPYRVSTRTIIGGRVLGAWIYYDNEQRPVERPPLAERSRGKRQRLVAEAEHRNLSGAAVFNAWIASG